MAKFYQSEKWRKRALSVTAVALSAAFSLGVFAACTDNDDDDDDDTSSVSAVDTQTIKNGNFEFYSEKEDDYEDKRAFINSPSSWSFSSGSPSSSATSGIIDTSEDAWKDLTQTGGYSFTTYTYSGENSDYENKDVTTFSGFDEAMAHWSDDNVSTYDRLYFLEIYQDDLDAIEEDDADAAEVEFFADYAYSIDYEDVQYLKEDVGNDFRRYSGANEDETNVLMIHNLATSNSIVGTAQYYTSSTTITLAAGTAAHLSVWVRTDNLYHYDSTDTDNPNVSGLEVSQRAGAYIGVTNTVGGTSLDQMQIKNINTNGGWEQYTVYIRANTYATTTFSVVLGLGQGSSSDRYESVNGYAFFDDLTCEIISAADYETAVEETNARECTINSDKTDKQFDMDDETASVYALDLYAAFDRSDLLSEATVALTSEKSGSNTYTTEKFGLGDSEDNFAALTDLSKIAATSNSYLKSVYENDLKEKYIWDDDGIVMLMSANGAAYTAKLNTFVVEGNSKTLISFFVKTSAMPSGYSAAGATIVELLNGVELNKTSISAFDSTTLSTVDIDSDDEEKSDIYKGWAQCFFFIENTTEEDITCRLDLTYGPTTIVGTDKTDYCDGYAAFTHFESLTLTNTQYGYATTGDQAVKVSLTGTAASTSSFDTVSATAEADLEEGPALPSNFTGTVGGSQFVVAGGGENVKPEQVYAGLISSEYVENYYNSTAAWRNVLTNGAATNADEWWTGLFGNARQPLVILNGEEASYGYYTSGLTISASSYQKISMNVKVSAGAVAYVYLVDVSSADKAGSLITPTVPNVTYWYNDYGNICKVDPTSDDYNSRTDVLYELQENGLYLKVNGDESVYYANLYNYETDEEGNLVTSDGTIAYYYKDGEYYAYYDEDTDVYSQVVKCLPKTDDNGNVITRYDYTDASLPTSVIVVDNADGEFTDWVTVTFYVATGNESKTYRLEVWSGDRTGEVTNPGGSYVFFDNYINTDASSDYSTLLDETVEAIKKENGVSSKENLSEEYALYYTYTFYDATSYLRYDETEDEDELGDPYGSYRQSSYSENIIYLYMDDAKGDLMKAGSAYAMFIDYTSSEVTVEADDLSTDDDTTDTTNDSDTNVMLLISSGILSVVLLFVIVLVIVQRLLKKFGRKKAKIKPAKDKRYRPETTTEEE